VCGKVEKLIEVETKRSGDSDGKRFQPIDIKDLKIQKFQIIIGRGRKMYGALLNLSE